MAAGRRKTEMTEQNIKNASHYLGSRLSSKNEYEALSIKLGISKEEASAIWKEYGEDYSRDYLEMLRRWQVKTGGYLEDLETALRQVGHESAGSDIDYVKELRQHIFNRTHARQQNTALVGRRRQTGYQTGKVKQANPANHDLDPEMNYVMWKSVVKGNALIIGNSDFPEQRGRREAHRPWAEMDIANMKTLLQSLGYDFRNDENIKRNLSRQDMDEAVRKFTEQPTSDNPQSAVVYISSHGSDKGVEGTDRNMLSIPTLLQHFSGVLLGKPKVLIIDACWGSGVTNLIPHSVPNSSTAAQSIDLLPENADIFMIHSTLYGNMAWSYEDRGSWFVNEMCKVFYSTDRELEDLDTIMLRVTKEIHSLRAHQLDDKGNRKMKGTQSTTVVKQGVTRKLFFFPGYSLDSQLAV